MRMPKIFNIQIVVTIIGILSLLVGVSFAIFSIVTNSSKNNVIKTGSISLNLVEEQAGIELDDLTEMTDLEGLSQENSYNFTITNNGTDEASYQILLADDVTAISEYEGTLLDDQYVRVGIRINGTEYGPMSLETVNRLIHEDFITSGETINCQLRLWINFDGLTANEKAALMGKSIFLNIKIIGNQILNLDGSGANKPDLVTGMVPVRYDGTNWVIADEDNTDANNQWYSYATNGTKKGMWANAVLVKEEASTCTTDCIDSITKHDRSYYTNQANVGQAVSMDDILQMYVWIPRFSATTNGNYNGGGSANTPGAFNITFVNKNTAAHDAFTFGEENLAGIWVGKFETSHSTLATIRVYPLPEETNPSLLSCNTETCTNANGILIKPNVYSLKWNNVSNFFYGIRSLEQNENAFGLNGNEVDTHMMKNNEWGAVAYLSQSIYGRCTSSTACPEIGINNNSSYITGYGAAAGSNTSATKGTYETTLGKGATTTGNIYGIYDMSGGTPEFVMGTYAIGTSGFSNLPNSKYYNLYTTSSNYTTAGLQHALVETTNWYGDDYNFVDSNNSWFLRGSKYNITNGGLFISEVNNGVSYYYGSRITIIK